MTVEGTARVTSRSLRELRDEGAVDQSLQNLLKALSLNLELRSRYRVFAFEAGQDGHTDVMEMFRALMDSQREQIAALSEALRACLGPSRVTITGPDLD